MKFKAWGILDNNDVVYIEDLEVASQTPGHMYSPEYNEEFHPEDHLSEDPLPLIRICKHNLEDEITSLSSDIEDLQRKHANRKLILNSLINKENTLIRGRKS